ncbi:MAG: hypothetical protein PUK22_04760 [Bacteroides sp.]|nr:hypothetical protein [Bacteroides sp.]
MMYYEKRLKDLTVGDLEGMTLEEMSKVIESVKAPDYEKIFQKARAAAESIFNK